MKRTRDPSPASERVQPGSKRARVTPRPKDVIFHTNDISLEGSFLVAVLSEEDFLFGRGVRVFLAYTPPRDADLEQRVEVMQALDATHRTRPPKEEALHQFLLHGPQGVEHWDALDDRYKKTTRAALGLSRVSREHLVLHYEHHDADSEPDCSHEDPA